MTEPNPGTDATRVAIECVTLWMERGADARLSTAAAGHIAELVHGAEGPGPGTVIAGLLNLNTLVLLDLMKQRGEHDVHGAAGEYLRHLSPRRRG